MENLSKGEMLTNPDLDRSENNRREKKAFCVGRKSQSSAHEKWEPEQKCCCDVFAPGHVFLSLPTGAVIPELVTFWCSDLSY